MLGVVRSPYSESEGDEQGSQSVPVLPSCFAPNAKSFACPSKHGALTTKKSRGNTAQTSLWRLAFGFMCAPLFAFHLSSGRPIWKTWGKKGRTCCRIRYILARKQWRGGGKLKLQTHMFIPVDMSDVLLCFCVSKINDSTGIQTIYDVLIMRSLSGPMKYIKFFPLKFCCHFNLLELCLFTCHTHFTIRECAACCFLAFHMAFRLQIAFAPYLCVSHRHHVDRI